MELYGLKGIFFFCLLNIWSSCWICVCIFLFFRSFKFWWWILFLLIIFLGGIIWLKFFWCCMLWLCFCYWRVLGGRFINVGIKGVVIVLEFEVVRLFWGGLRVNFVKLVLVLSIRFLEGVVFFKIGGCCWWFVCFMLLLFICRIGFMMLLLGCGLLVGLEYDCVIIFFCFGLNLWDFVFLLFVWLWIY